MRMVARMFMPLLVAVVLAAPTATHAAQGAKPARTPGPAAYSGFLADYSRLQADPGDPAYLRYVAPGLEAAHYRKFLLETPQLIVNTGGAYQALDPARANDLIEYYRGRMAAALGEHYDVVSQPGPGVVRLKVAVVAAVEVRAPLKPRNLLPVSALFHVARAAAGKNPYVLRMSMESEALDAQSGALLGEAVDSRESTRKVAKGEAVSSAQLHQLIDFWIDRFVARLDKANGFGH